MPSKHCTFHSCRHAGDIFQCTSLLEFVNLLAGCFSFDHAQKQISQAQCLVLRLSFIGWKILSSITYGLVGLFYANPYEYATDAELFLILKQNYFSGRSYSNTYQTY